jgi:hypothetical protein
MKRVIRFVLPLFAAIVPWLAAPEVRADIVTVAFSGTFSTTSGVLPVNTAFSGSYVYDSSVSPTSTAANTATYPMTSFIVQINSDVFTASTSTLAISDGIAQGAGVEDRIWASSFDMSGPQVGIWSMNQAGLFLTDTSASALNATSLPTGFSIGPFSQAGDSLAFNTGWTRPGFQVPVRGTISSITVTSVPEPASLTLIAFTGGIGILLRRRRSKKV